MSAAPDATRDDVRAVCADMKHTITVLNGQIRSVDRAAMRARLLRDRLRREMAEMAAVAREHAAEEARREAALARFRTRRH